MGMPDRAAAALLLAGCLLWMPAGPADARSAHSPRHSGTEMPGIRSRLPDMPMAGVPMQSGGTGGPANAGRGGRMDAYGRPITDGPAPEAAPRRRLPPGAYGGYGGRPAGDAERLLPDPNPPKPAWKF